MDKQEPIGEWISFRDALPLAWSTLPQPPVEAEFEHLHEQNLRMLAVVSTLEERRRRLDPSGDVEVEIERLHHKVDALLELAGALLRVHQALPDPVPVRLSREGLCWSPVADAPAVGAHIRVAIHLHPCAVHPFVWTARVISVGDEVCAAFDALGEALGAALERHVFMHHRRSVAGSRQPASR